LKPRSAATGEIYGEEAALQFASDFYRLLSAGRQLPFRTTSANIFRSICTKIANTFIGSLPAVVNVEKAQKLQSRSRTLESYPGLWLKGTGGNGPAATFPPYPLKEELTRDRDYKSVQAADYIATTVGTRTFPWRVIESPTTMATLITTRSFGVGKTIAKWKTRRGSSRKGGVGTGGCTTFTLWIFMAAITQKLHSTTSTSRRKYGILYIILDEGWYKLGNGARRGPGKSTSRNLTRTASRKMLA